MTGIVRFAAALTAIFALVPSVARGQMREQEIIQNANTVFEQMTSLHVKAIPQALLADAEGVAIIPNVIKGGFVIGARHGKGVLLIRDGQGLWQTPVFVSLTGGNVGWQAGVQSTDLILVFKTRRSVNGILNGKITLGADAAAAAGPVGRQAAAATDGRLQAEIYSYSRSRGLFAGVSVDGSVLRVESDLNAAYYQSGKVGEPYYVPESALALVDKVASYCQPAHGNHYKSALPPEEESIEELPSPAANQLGGADVVRPQLAAATDALSKFLDQQWMSYLAIPPQVHQNGPHPSQEAVQRSLARLETVAQDPRYGMLWEREEFQRTLGLLREYERFLVPQETAWRLPPPPVVTDAAPVSLR